MAAVASREAVNNNEINGNSGSPVEPLVSSLDGNDIDSQLWSPQTTGQTPSQTPLTACESDDTLFIQSEANKKNAKKQKKKKPKPTKADCESVRQHFKYAKQRDIEKVLRENHSHLLKKRDEIYATSRKNGITENSSRAERLAIIGKIVHYCFFNIEPPNEYTAVSFASVCFGSFWFPLVCFPFVLICLFVCSFV